MSTPETQKKNPITLKIKFKSASIEQFIERYSVDVSRGGIFIRTKEPLAVGTPLRFEFQLQDGTALISGDGTVVWNRAADPNRPTVVPGMGVRFDKLTTDSQRVLERILSDKEKLGNTGLESRFDAGVRASLGVAAETAPSQETPKGNMFGEEPTRAMSADQVNKLAEASQRAAGEEDLPTKLGPVSDLSEEVRKLAGPSGDGSGSLPAIPTAGMQMSAGAKLEPMRVSGAGGMVRSTLIGQGFGLTPTSAPSSPGGLSGPSGLKDPSSPAIAAAQIDAASAPLDSQVTPVKSAEASHVAESQRTPTGTSNPNQERPSDATPVPAQASTSGPVRSDTPTPEPMASNSQSAPSPVKPDQSLESAQHVVKASGGSSGLLVGAALLLLLVAAAGYFVFVFQKGQPDQKVPTTEQVQPPPPRPPQPPPLLTPEKGATEAGKGTPEHPAEVKGEPGGKPAEATPPIGDGIEVTSEPAGAQVELAGKAVGVTPTKLPTLVAGKTYDLKVSLHGYLELRQKLKGGEEAKPLPFKLVAIERQLEVLSTPKGADVYIDGKKVGRTPWIMRKVDLSKAMTVEIRRAGFETWTHNVSDAEAFTLRNKKETLTLNATLEPASGKKPRQKKVEEAPAPPPEPVRVIPQRPAPEPVKVEPAKPEEAPKAAPEPAKVEPAKPEEPAKPAP